MYNENQIKITKIKLLHINKYIKPSYLGTDQYRVQTETISQIKFYFHSSMSKWRKTRLFLL